MIKRQRPGVFNLAFLDIMSCGFGAVLLFFMIINHTSKIKTDTDVDLFSETQLLQKEILQGEEARVLLRNSLVTVDQEANTVEGLARIVLEELKDAAQRLRDVRNQNLARETHVNQLMADVENLNREARDLEQSIEEQITGDSVRGFSGSADRQYLTGIKVGGKRVLILIDASASMLGDTIVNILRRRNLPLDQRKRADKWQHAIRVVEWISSQVKPGAEFQMYTFNTVARPLVANSGGAWLQAGTGEKLEQAITALRDVVPQDGTSLHAAIGVINAMQPAPDSVFLLVDGLPTIEKEPRTGVTKGRQRIRFFDRAVKELKVKMPINIILFPLEGDPFAAAAYWELAQVTTGAMITPSRDWP